VVVYLPITSLKNIFEQLKEFESIFEFLFNVRMLKSLYNGELKNACTNFKVVFSHKDLSGVDANDIFFN